MKYQEAIVISNKSLGENICHLCLGANKPIPFEAGQFFLLRLKNQDGDFVERSYSIANFSGGKNFEFIIRIEHQGQMTSLINRLKKGMNVDIKGPFGRFGQCENAEKPKITICIAGGVGIAPFRSIIQQKISEKNNTTLQLFYGFRTQKDFLFQKEFERWSKMPWMRFYPVNGRKNMVSDALTPKIADPKTGACVFVCGPPPMVKKTREKLLSLGFDHEQIHVEAW